MTYDLIVIGGGPAGYIGAERAGQSGLATLLIEKRSLGGVCLNEGCIPTKTFLYSAKILDTIKNGEKYGVTAGAIAFSHKTVLERKNKVVRSLVSGVASRLKKHNVTVLEGTAEITGKKADGCEVRAGGAAHVGKRLLTATGSIPVFPDVKGLKEQFDKGFVLTNKEILDLETPPQSLVIIGGGIIGLEFASYFASIGTRVTVVEMLSKIAGGTDVEISELLLKTYKKRGVDFKLNATVVEVNDKKVVYRQNGTDQEIGCEKILLSVGRKPVIGGFGLENIFVETGNGKIKSDSGGKTNIPEVYVAGDVNGISMLAHTAYREAEVCVNNMLGTRDVIRYGAIPSVIYSNPEVAMVGLTEEAAKEKGIEYEAAKLSMRFSGRFMAENEMEDGLCKILIEKSSKKIIGVHLLGNYSSEIIYGAALMMECEMRVKDVKELVFPHPSVSEILREAIFQF